MRSNCHLVLIVFLSLSGCQHFVDRSDPFGQERSYLGFGVSERDPLSIAQVIQIAKKEAVSRGLQLEQYGEPTASGPANNVWLVHFDRKPTCAGCVASIGSDFSISVNEKSHTTFYGPGR